MSDLRAASSQVRRLLTRYRRLLSALLAAISVLTIVQAVAPASSARQPVVVAARDLASGTALAASDVTVAQMPPALVPAGSTASVDRIVGRSLAGPMRAGEVVTDRRLIGPPLIAGYPRGAVAAPVRIADPGAVSLLQVGDRIDVYAARSDVSAADLVVGHAPVVALPRLDDGAQQGSLVVLAVTPYQAATLAGASAVGPLSVTLLR